jgi:hypothetical protein
LNIRITPDRITTTIYSGNGSPEDPENKNRSAEKSAQNSLLCKPYSDFLRDTNATKSQLFSSLLKAKWIIGQGLN